MKKIQLILLLFAFNTTFGQEVPTSGFLMPRKTTAERVAFPANTAKGIHVYDTDTESLWFYDGSSWIVSGTDKIIPLWQSNTNGGSYAINDIINYNGFIYRNITGTNTNTSPNNDATNWTSNLEPDSGWIDVNGGVGFQNNWVDFDNRRRVQYRKVGKLVQIRGLTKDGLVGVSRYIFTLPVGFRPSIGDSGTGLIFTTWHNTTSINRVQVNQDGGVVAYSSITSPLALDGIMFFVD